MPVSVLENQLRIALRNFHEGTDFIICDPNSYQYCTEKQAYDLANETFQLLDSFKSEIINYLKSKE